MSAAVDLTRYARRKTVRLTTVGRRSGQPRQVVIWFVVDGAGSISVQHVAKRPAQWYRNLVANPQVRIDFGDGPIDATGEAVENRAEIAEVMAKIGRKYWTYRLVRLFGGGVDDAVAARIRVS